jgi:hypothetical protein
VVMMIENTGWRTQFEFAAAYSVDCVQRSFMVAMRGSLTHPHSPPQSTVPHYKRGRKDSLHTHIVRSARAGIDTVVVVATCDCDRKLIFPDLPRENLYVASPGVNAASHDYRSIVEALGNHSGVGRDEGRRRTVSQ